MSDESQLADRADRADLAALDPFDIYDRESERVIAALSSLSDGDVRWNQPSRCPGWAVRDVVAHLLWSERYHDASLKGALGEFLSGLAAQGVTSLDEANDLGVDELRHVTPRELLGTWKKTGADHRARFRARGDGLVDTSVGEYPAKLQVFHLAAELATHADDMHLPVDEVDVADRFAWRAAVARLALSEIKPELTIELIPTGTRVTGDGIVIEADDREFVEGVAGHLDETSRLDAAARALLSIP